jgi:hypothetical protein
MPELAAPVVDMPPVDAPPLAPLPGVAPLVAPLEPIRVPLEGPPLDGAPLDRVPEDLPLPGWAPLTTPDPAALPLPDAPPGGFEEHDSTNMRAAHEQARAQLGNRPLRARRKSSRAPIRRSSYQDDRLSDQYRSVNRGPDVEASDRAHV